MPQETLLQTRSLTKEFRGFRAVSDVDLVVRDGTVHALVGPNGAGKTTLFNLLTGFLSPTSGSIEYAGQDITGKRPEDIAHLGIARSFQITSLFDALTLREHLELALASPTGLGMRFWQSAKRFGSFEDRATALLDRVGLADRAGLPEVCLDHPVVLSHLLVVALGEDAAGLQHRHDVGERPDDVHVVVDEDDGAALGDLLDQGDGAVDVLDAHPGGGLVEEEELRVEGQGDGQFQRALLPVCE